MTPPDIRSVRFLGSARAARTDGWALAGQDGGQSIVLGDRVLFVFSDTLLGVGDGADRLARSPGSLSKSTAHFLANCAGVSRETSLVGALGDVRYFCDPPGRPLEILRATAVERLAGYRFWPQHGLYVGGKVYLFYLGIRQVDQRQTWGFRPAGSGLAVLDPETGECERLSFGAGRRLWPELEEGLHVGVQVLQEGDTAYVFSSHRRGVASHARLARVPAGRISDPDAYEHLASVGPTWTRRAEAGCDLAACGPEFSVSFNPYLGRYLMVYVDGFKKELHLRTALKPWGPYSESRNAGVLPHRTDAELISLGFEHPAFSRDGGKTVFISYCQPHFTQNSLIAVAFS